MSFNYQQRIFIESEHDAGLLRPRHPKWSAKKLDATKAAALGISNINSMPEKRLRLKADVACLKNSLEGIRAF